MAQSIEERRRKNREYMREYSRKRMQTEPDKVREEKRLWAEKARKKDPQKYREAVKKYARANPEKVKTSYQRWVKKNPKYHSDYTHERIARNYISFLLYNCRRRAEKLGVPFSLAHEDIEIPTICPVLGIPILSAQVRGRGTFSHNSPSVDRVVPELGYVPKNIRIISARANNLKNNGTPEELMAVARYAKEETDRVRALFP